MNPRYRVYWTDAAVSLLRKLAEARYSAAKIAENIPGASRNAVIGKCHRLGVQLDPLRERWKARTYQARCMAQQQRRNSQQKKKDEEYASWLAGHPQRLSRALRRWDRDAKASGKIAAKD